MVESGVHASMPDGVNRMFQFLPGTLCYGKKDFHLASSLLP